MQIYSNEHVTHSLTVRALLIRERFDALQVSQHLAPPCITEENTGGVINVAINNAMYLWKLLELVPLSRKNWRDRTNF